MNRIKSFYRNHTRIIKRLLKIILRIFLVFVFLFSFTYGKIGVLIILGIFICFDLIKQKCYPLFFDMLLLTCLWIGSLPSLTFYYGLEEFRFRQLKDSYNKKVESILPELEESSELVRYETDLMFLSEESYILYAKQQDSTLILFITSENSTGYLYYSDEKAKEWLNAFNYTVPIDSHWCIYDMFPMNYPKDGNIEFTLENSRQLLRIVDG